jgi:SAM-dependent methyltransferase
MENRKIIRYKIQKKVKETLHGKTADDFDWELYNIHYRGELEDISKNFTQILKKDDYIFKNGKLVKKRKTILPLLPYHELLYETILQLHPESVMELGCGGGDHLANIHLLSPEIKIHGFDLSDKQLALFRDRHPDFHEEIEQFDCTVPFPKATRKVDIAFTQAVIMHIQTGKKHLNVLQNMFSIANKQVILMENWTKHRFMDDIDRLFERKKIPWPEIHYHYRISNELKKAIIMIVSPTPIEEYPVLTDYKVLSR